MFWRRCAGFLGASCLVVSLLLVPLGVRIVRAEDGRPPTAPQRDAEVRARRPAPDTLPVPTPSAATSPREAVAPGPRSVEPGATDAIVPLNTTGYNYKPDRQGRDAP